MEISSHEELQVLHRALMERHFSENMFSRELVASPILAGLCHRLLDELIEVDVAKKGEAERATWHDWRVLDAAKGRVWRLFVERLLDPERQSHLRTTSEQDLNAYIRNVASPYIIDDDELRKLKETVLNID